MLLLGLVEIVMSCAIISGNQCWLVFLFFKRTLGLDFEIKIFLEGSSVGSSSGF
jgi:hypothetical protein